MVKSKGFSFLELSIVLMIIAAIVGVIFSALSIKRSAQLQSAVREYDTYVKAIVEFQDKYKALPGDMLGSSGFRPTDMWGTDPCGCPCTTSATLTSLTCNGDGNGHIGDSDVNGNIIQSTGYELHRSWQHLSNAGFIKGQFTGSPADNTNTTYVRVGLNSPASVITGAGWSLFYLKYLPGGGPDNGALWRDYQYGHILLLGANTAPSYAYGPVLTPSEAFEIDQKIDDGKPGTGNMRANRVSVYSPNCTTNDTSQTAQTYNVSYNGAACGLFFLTGF